MSVCICNLFKNSLYVLTLKIYIQKEKTLTIPLSKDNCYSHLMYLFLVFSSIFFLSFLFFQRTKGGYGEGVLENDIH